MRLSYGWLLWRLRLHEVKCKECQSGRACRKHVKIWEFYWSKQDSEEWEMFNAIIKNYEQKIITVKIKGQEKERRLNKFYINNFELQSSATRFQELFLI